MHTKEYIQKKNIRGIIYKTIPSFLERGIEIIRFFIFLIDFIIAVIVSIATLDIIFILFIYLLVCLLIYLFI